MKKYVAVLAATAVLGVTSAFAAHPFSDVTAQDWAYQAVERLAAEGVIEGYPDGTFKGQRNITRYEMAQMIARADAHKDEVTAEQKATIQRLAIEFANELQAFGVRVNKLEDQVGNFKFSGDARVRYINTDFKEKKTSFDKSGFTYRARVKFEADANDKTKVAVRLFSGDTPFSVENSSGGPQGDEGNGIDEAYIQYKLNQHDTVTIGKFDYIIGNGLSYDEDLRGVMLKHETKKLDAILALGYVKSNDKEVSVYQLNYHPSDNAEIKGFYVDRHGSKNNGVETKRTTDIFGTSLDVKLGHNHNIWLGGEYVRKVSQGASGEAWTAGIGYGNADITKKGTWGVKVQYFNFKRETFVKYTTWNTPTHKVGFDESGRADYKGWLATVDYTLAKNAKASVYAGYQSKRQDGEKLPNYYGVDLNYQF